MESYTIAYQDNLLGVSARVRITGHRRGRASLEIPGINTLLRRTVT